MKKVLTIALIATGLMASINLHAQGAEDKSKRPSPPAKVTEKIESGASISIDYSQPSVKNRTIGKDLEPMDGEVWRTGANEATVFESDKNVSINGAALPAGKYALFTLFKGDDVTLIFNKTWKQWGAFKYKEGEDQLRVKTKYTTTGSPSEKMEFKINNEGEVTLLWGNRKIEFMVK